MARRASGQNNPRVTLADLIAGGLGVQAAWITEEFRDVAEFHDWLSARNPGVTRPTSQAAFRWARFARDAAQMLNRGDRPPLGVVPIDPTIQANRGYRYELEITFREPEEGRRNTPFDRTTQPSYWVYHTNELQTLEQLRRSAPRSIIQRLARSGNNRRDRSPVPQGFQEFEVEITIRTVSRRGG